MSRGLLSWKDPSRSNGSRQKGLAMIHTTFNMIIIEAIEKERVRMCGRAIREKGSSFGSIEKQRSYNYSNSSSRRRQIYGLRPKKKKTENVIASAKDRFRIGVYRARENNSPALYRDRKSVV